MIEINSALIAVIALMVSVIGVVFGAYIQVTKVQTIHDGRLNSLEEKANVLFTKADNHEEHIARALEEIKESVHRVELNMEKHKYADRG